MPVKRYSCALCSCTLPAAHAVTRTGEVLHVEYAGFKLPEPLDWVE